MAPLGRTLIVGHNPGGVFWSDDAGSTWFQGAAVAPLAGRAGELLDTAPVWEMKSGDGLVLAGASDGIYSSADRGRTWTRARAGLPPKCPGVSFLITSGLILAGAIASSGN